MDSAVFASLLALVGTCVGSFTGIITANKLVNYRIQQLEIKVEKHNQVIERVYKLEKHEAVTNEKIKELEEYHK